MKYPHLVAILIFCVGCSPKFDHDAELTRIRGLVPTLSKTAKVVARKGTKEDAGELWLISSDDPVVPVNEPTLMTSRQIKKKTQNVRISSSTVLVLADQLQAELSGLGNPSGEDAHLYEIAVSAERVRIRDLKMERGWLSTIERLPGEAGSLPP